MNIQQLFFELIQVALGVRICLSRTPNDTEWKALYDMAKKQSLVGVCFAGVRRLKAQRQEPPEMLYLTWMGMAAKIQQRNEVMNRQCMELQAKLAADRNASCILKGQSVAKYYGESLAALRQSGDIDVWLDGSPESIMEYVDRISPTDEVRWLHAQMKFFPDTDVEVHFRPSYLECPWQDRALQKYFDSEKEACFANSRCTDRFNQVFILSHTFRHLFGEGVGLRQLMDYYFVLKNSKERMTCNEFSKIMKDSGMLKFAKALMWIMKDVFGLEEEHLLCTPSESNGRFLLEEIMMSGNFGHHDVRLNHSAEESDFVRFWRISLYNCRVIRFSPWIVLCSPIWRLWHWSWRKRKGYN